MTKPITENVMGGAPQVVIWQPWVEGFGSEPALLVQRDAGGLLCISQEGRTILLQPETVAELTRQLKRLAEGGRP